jgi:hypothetical protein
MQEDVLIHQKSDQKVCNIEEHYELVTIEFNSMKMSIAVEKIISFLTKEDVSNLKENASLMTKSLTKEDVSKLKENLSIVTKEDASIEKKMNTKQKENVSILKKSDTDFVLTAVTAAEAVSSGEEKLVNHQELISPAIPASDWLKSAPDNLKKRRSLVSKKRCKKSRSLHHQKEVQKETVQNLKIAVRCKQAAKAGFSHQFEFG